MKKKIKALIPVRAGSVRVVNKNIKPFCGTNLLALKIEQMLRIKEIDEVCVSSESQEMLDIAKDLGATPIRRDAKFASNECSPNDVWEHIADNIDCEYILYTAVTNPLVKDDSYRNCIEKYFSLDENVYSLNTVTSVKEFLWMGNSPVNYDPNNQPKSQDLPEVFHLNFAINILRRDLMKKHKSILLKNFFPFYLDKIESTDIDDVHDFLIAELLYKNQNNLL
jgi:CMP-N-acetylneuraminic acid synthetase